MGCTNTFVQAVYYIYIYIYIYIGVGNGPARPEGSGVGPIDSGAATFTA